MQWSGQQCSGTQQPRSTYVFSAPESLKQVAVALWDNDLVLSCETSKFRRLRLSNPLSLLVTRVSGAESVIKALTCQQGSLVSYTVSRVDIAARKHCTTHMSQPFLKFCDGLSLQAGPLGWHTSSPVSFRSLAIPPSEPLLHPDRHCTYDGVERKRR